MHPEKISNFASLLHRTRLDRKTLDKLSSREKFSLPTAYDIQEAGILLRREEGEKVIGRKMGLTSQAKREQMNLDRSIYGVLTDKMQLTERTVSILDKTVHPKIEPEIAFYIAKDLKGKVTREEVLDACSWVCAAMEILDSRYQGFKYFSLEDVVADNSSSSYFVLGKEKSDPRKVDVRNLKMKMKAGEETVEGNSNAISGDPICSVRELCELLSEQNLILEAGNIVLAGAATLAVNLKKGMHVELMVEKLGEVSLEVR